MNSKNTSFIITIWLPLILLAHIITCNHILLIFKQFGIQVCSCEINTHTIHIICVNIPSRMRALAEASLSGMSFQNSMKNLNTSMHVKGKKGVPTPGAPHGWRNCLNNYSTACLSSFWHKQVQSHWKDGWLPHKVRGKTNLGCDTDTFISTAMQSSEQ